jgi:hypothetical protein
MALLRSAVNRKEFGKILNQQRTQDMCVHTSANFTVLCQSMEVALTEAEKEEDFSSGKLLMHMAGNFVHFQMHPRFRHSSPTLHRSHLLSKSWRDARVCSASIETHFHLEKLAVLVGSSLRYQPMLPYIHMLLQEFLLLFRGHSDGTMQDYLD